MGEARHRAGIEQEAADQFRGIFGRELSDMSPGDPLPDERRYAGDPLEWLQEHIAMAGRRARGHQVEASVPCDGCSLCCKHPPMHAGQHEREGDADYQAWITLPDGRMTLDSGPDGYCVHHTPAGCGIYEHRPALCRSYDCRIEDLMGMPPGGRPSWVFSAKTRKSASALRYARDETVRFATSHKAPSIVDCWSHLMKQIVARI